MLKYKFLIILIMLLLAACNNNMENQNIVPASEPDKVYNTVRKAAVAGGFYSNDPEELKKQINNYLADAGGDTNIQKESVKAIMVPHAGYVYSGAVAAKGFKLLEGRRVDNVFIVCNSHTAYFEGAAVDDSEAWETPLGTVEVNLELAKKITDSNDAINLSSKAHLNDHTLEIQLPFLQTVLKNEFKIVPVLFGNSSGSAYKELARNLIDNLGVNDILIISSDMSHYPAYADAKRIDNKTLELIKAGDINELEKHIKETEQAGIENEQTLLCGIDGVRTGMIMAEALGWDREILEYANSGDVAVGDKDRVVGYGVMVFGQKIVNSKQTTVKTGTDVSDKDGNQINGINILNKEQKEALLHIARATVELFVREGKIPEFDIIDERLKWKEGAFTTLTIGGQLKGCIGQIVPSGEPLWAVVRDMAVAACSEDNRFLPVTEDDLKNLEYEVSVLSVPEKIDDWQKIEMGKHGVIVKSGFQGGVFLPQVAEHFNNDREAFLAELCSQKAGLPRDCYKSGDVELEVFTAQVFSKEDVE